MSAVEVVELRRTFRTRAGIRRRSRVDTEAVRGISFAIAPGELFGLVGPNGAGKTTTIKMLTTLLVPSGGSARVLDFDVVRDTGEVRKRIGYVFGGERGLYDRLSAFDNLNYFADIYRVPHAQKRRRIAELLELVSLEGRERERVETYSRGMRQRLHIARGLLHDPPVLLLDEPTIGLDPIGARELRSTIAQLRDGGKTILLTTHYMFEADELCGRMAVIAKGQIIAQGTPTELKAVVADRTIVEIEAFGVDESTIARLRAVRGVASVAIEAREQAHVIRVMSSSGPELVQPLMRQLEGVNVGSVISRQPTLEDAYVELVSRS